MVKVLVTETCNGCGGTDAKAVCVRSCPAKILTVKHDHPSNPKAKGIVHVIDDYFCVECYACETFCPVKAIFINPPEYGTVPLIKQIYEDSKTNRLA